ncbi:MAG: sel1 repeat family protein [Tannerella sp.]|jgi:TPR repeat protein|nr:sel1 repeat family protein [Tannerella sp.]
MKRTILIFVCIISLTSLYGQNEKRDGDDMAAAENYSGAAMMYRLCMERDEECQIKLIRLIYEEKIEPQSADELYRLISPLAEHGNAEAQYYLSELYKKGRGGASQDYGEMMKWLQKSAAQNYANTRTELAKLYELTEIRGDELAADGHFNEAANMYRLALEHDGNNALKLFKIIHDKKAETQQSDELFRLLSPLVAKGNPEAQYDLSLMYRTGVGGVQRNEDEANKWLKMSADQGFPIAKEEYTAMFPPVEVETPVVTAQTVTTQTARPTAVRTPDISKSSYQAPKAGPKGGVLLMILGGLSIAGGTAATYMLPPEKDYDWTSRINEGKVLPKENRINTYLYAGCAVGAACVITGIVLKIKQNKNRKAALYDNYSLQPSPEHDSEVQLNLVSTGVGAGLRLTF